MEFRFYVLQVLCKHSSILANSTITNLANQIHQLCGEEPVEDKIGK